MRLIKDKKANPSWFLITIIISIISFLLYLVVFSNITGGIVSETDDLACRAYVSLKNFGGVKIGEFFYTINEKCKKDSIKISSSEKEEIFQETGDLMKRCWYRYGEGEYDFLSNWKSTGNWCFLCGEIEFTRAAKEGSESLDFNDFIKWSEENKIRLKGGNEMTYYDYINFKYADISTEELNDVNRQLLEEIENANGDNKEVLMMLSQQQQSLQDLRLKEINPEHKTYVVYRYDRIEGDVLDKAIQTLTGGVGGVITGIGVGMLVENALWMGGTALVCLTSPTGIGAVACGAMATGMTAKLAKTSKNIATGVAKVTQINKIAAKFGDAIKFSKKAKLLGNLDEALKLGKVEDIVKVANALKKIDPDAAETVLRVTRLAEDLHIDDIALIEEKLAKSVSGFETAKDLIELNTVRKARATKTSNVKEYERKLENNIDKAVVEQMNIDNLVKLEDEAATIVSRVSNPSQLSPSESAKLGDYIRSLPVFLGGFFGASIGAGLDFNSNQYVDVMTQEQYYRLCGTSAGNFE